MSAKFYVNMARHLQDKQYCISQEITKDTSILVHQTEEFECCVRGLIRCNRKASYQDGVMTTLVETKGVIESALHALKESDEDRQLKNSSLDTYNDCRRRLQTLIDEITQIECNDLSIDG